MATPLLGSRFVRSPINPALGSCLGRSQARAMRFNASRKRAYSPIIAGLGVNPGKAVAHPLGSGSGGSEHAPAPPHQFESAEQEQTPRQRAGQGAAEERDASDVAGGEALRAGLARTDLRGQPRGEIRDEEEQHGAGEGVAGHAERADAA